MRRDPTSAQISSVNRRPAVRGSSGAHHRKGLGLGQFTPDIEKGRGVVDGAQQGGIAVVTQGDDSRPGSLQAGEGVGELRGGCGGHRFGQGASKPGPLGPGGRMGFQDGLGRAESPEQTKQGGPPQSRRQVKPHPSLFFRRHLPLLQFKWKKV